MGVAALRSFYEGRQFEAGFWLYRSLMADGHTADPEVHYYGARCARGMGDYHGARAAIDRAEECRPQGSMLGQVLFTRGLLLLEIGEYLSAGGDLMRCVERFDLYPDLKPVMAGPLWFNLGFCYRMSRQYDKALTAYRQSIQLFQQESMGDYERQGWQNVAWVRCLIGDTAGAREALEAAEPLLSGDGSRWQQKLGQAFLLSLGDDHTAAMRLCEEICSHPGELELDIRSHAYWIAGRIALDMGRPTEAESLARQAQEWAARARGENRCLHDAADLLRAIRERVMKPTGL